MLYRVKVDKAISLEGKRDASGFVSFSNGKTAEEAREKFSGRMRELGYEVIISGMECLGEMDLFDME